MEWHTLDDSLRRDQVIEGFESFIWTERYSSFGDFQIVTKSTPQSRALLRTDRRIGKVGSTYVATITTVTDETDDQGIRNLTVVGNFLEEILDDRVGMPGLDDLTTTPTWNLSGLPADIAREMFTTICVDGAIDPGDTIPFYTPGTLLPDGSLGEPTTPISVSFQPATLYASLKALCDTFALGFRFVKNGDAGQIYFEIYVGSDRTSDQSDLPAVIFDPNMDNLARITVLKSTAIRKTVAYVYAQNGMQVVYAFDGSPEDSGSSRLALVVNSNNTNPAGPDLDAALQAEGQIALASQRTVFSFDGELPQQVPYVYGRDYNLGDLVTERNSDGIGNKMLVTEQIFVSDNQGERAYPTLTFNNVLTPGSWLLWSDGTYWADVPPTDHWDDIP